MAQILFTDKLKGSVLTHQDVNEIKQTVNINGANSITTVKNVGDSPAGHGVFKEKPDGNTVSLKNMVAGTGMTVGSTDNDVVFTITDTGVTSGDYTFPKFTVNSQGQITSIASNEQDIRDLFSVEIGAATLDGNLSYDEATGIIKYFPTATRSRVSVAAGSGLTYDTDTGVFGTFNIPNSQLLNSTIEINSYRTSLGGAVTLRTDDIAENTNSAGNSNATNQWFTQQRVWDSITLNNLAAAGAGSLTYNSSNGNFYFKPTKDSWVRSLFSVGEAAKPGDGLDYDNTTGVFTLTATTTEIEEGTNLYFTTARARDSVSAGNGLSYDKATGVFTTKTTDSVTYNSITASNKVVTNNIEARGTGNTVTVNDSMIVTNNMSVSGNLTVKGTTTSVLAENVQIKDSILTLNSNVTGATVNPTEDAGFEVARGKEDNVQFTWDETLDVWTTNSQELRASLFRGAVVGNVTGDVTGQVSDVSNHSTTDISEGNNLYYTNARARGSISLSGDGLNYNNSTGKLTLTASTTEIEEGTNLYYTDTRARSAISKAADNTATGGGALSYNSSTGQFTFTPADVSGGARSSISLSGDGLHYDNSTGKLTLTASTSEIEEGTNLYYTDTRARGSISLSGDGMHYDNSTGKLTLTASTSEIEEGTNQYFTASRAKTALGYSGSGLDTDLTTINTAIGGKAASSHSHAISDVTNLQTTLNGKAAASHTHAISDVTNLQTTLNGKAASSHTHAISDVTNLQTTLNGKAASSHSHAISDVTNLQTTLNGKAASVHTHAISDVTNLQTALDGKLEDITNEQIQDLGNVLITSPLNGQTLVYDDGTGLWKNEFTAGGTALSACSACDLGDSADVEITSVQTGDTIQWDGTRWVNVDSVGRRNTANASTSNIADGASDDITIVAAKSYMLQKIETSTAAWVTLYTDTASRTADASRTQTTDPAPGSGVIAEVITSGASTQLITPGVMGFNNDGTPSDNVYLKVENQSGSSAAITVTLTYVKMEY